MKKESVKEQKQAFMKPKHIKKKHNMYENDELNKMQPV